MLKTKFFLLIIILFYGAHNFCINYEYFQRFARGSLMIGAGASLGYVSSLGIYLIKNTDNAYYHALKPAMITSVCVLCAFIGLDVLDTIDKGVRLERNSTMRFNKRRFIYDATKNITFPIALGGATIIAGLGTLRYWLKSNYGYG